MITPLTISGISMELDDAIKRYVRRKIGGLDRYVPRHARQSIHGEVRLREANKDHGNKYECDVVLHLPNKTITAADSTLNAFAAVDIVEEKLKIQLKQYKDEKLAHHGTRLLRSLRRQPVTTETADEAPAA